MKSYKRWSLPFEDIFSCIIYKISRERKANKQIKPIIYSSSIVSTAQTSVLLVNLEIEQNLSNSKEYCSYSRLDTKNLQHNECCTFCLSTWHMIHYKTLQTKCIVCFIAVRISNNLIHQARRNQVYNISFRVNRKMYLRM